MKKLFITLVFILSLVGCSEATITKVEDTKATSTKSPTEETKKEVATPEIYKIGDTVAFNDLHITLNSAEYSKGGEYEKPAEGNQYIVLDITADNKGTEEATVSSIMNTSMVDGEGYEYQAAFVTFVKNQLDGTVAAGRKLRGQLAFEVPKEAKTLEFIYSEVFSSGQAIFKVK